MIATLLRPSFRKEAGVSVMTLSKADSTSRWPSQLVGHYDPHCPACYTGRPHTIALHWGLLNSHRKEAWDGRP